MRGTEEQSNVGGSKRRGKKRGGGAQREKAERERVRNCAYENL